MYIDMESELIKEEWRDVIGYEGLYQVSNLGRVKRIEKYDSIGRKLKEKILKFSKDRFGYLRLILTKDGKESLGTVHRLVAQAFIPNQKNLPQVNHRNECPTDNSVWNLEWCDASYNINYGRRNKRAADAMSMPILQLDMNNNLIKEWESLSEASRKLNISLGNICNSCKGKRKSCGGFKWKYKEEKVS